MACMVAYTRLPLWSHSDVCGYTAFYVAHIKPSLFLTAARHGAAYNYFIVASFLPCKSITTSCIVLQC